MLNNFTPLASTFSNFLLKLRENPLFARENYLCIRERELFTHKVFSITLLIDLGYAQNYIQIVSIKFSCQGSEFVAVEHKRTETVHVSVIAAELPDKCKRQYMGYQKRAYFRYYFETKICYFQVWFYGFQ
jgi:hypothetical protein